MTLSPYIDRNRAALLRMLVTLFAASGLGLGRPAVLSRIIRRSVLFSLRPLESAGRRLVVAKACLLRQDGVAAPVRAPRGKPTGPIPRGMGARVPPFALFDARRRLGVARVKYAKHAPRLSFFDGRDPVVEPVVDASPSAPDAPVDAARLSRRLQALKAALDDLPKAAKRLMRMEARRATLGKGLIRPMRPGRPPGHRTRRRFEADEVLSECHQLALMALAAPDTS